MSSELDIYPPIDLRQALSTFNSAVKKIEITEGKKVLQPLNFPAFNNRFGLILNAMNTDAELGSEERVEEIGEDQDDRHDVPAGITPVETLHPIWSEFNQQHNLNPLNFECTAYEIRMAQQDKCIPESGFLPVMRSFLKENVLDHLEIYEWEQDFIEALPSLEFSYTKSLYNLATKHVKVTINSKRGTASFSDKPSPSLRGGSCFTVSNGSPSTRPGRPLPIHDPFDSYI